MFASPFTAPLHETLAQHVFGRFMPQRAPSAVADVGMGPVQAAAALTEDDGIPDLAQRVREVGEW